LTVSAGRLAVCSSAAGIVVIDARDSSSYSDGHLPGSVSLPPESLPDVSSRDDFARLTACLGAAGLTGEETIICYGQTTWSGAAGRLFWMLELAGASDAQILDGGLTSWVAEGRELSTEPFRLPPNEWSLEPVPTRVATRDDVAAAYGTDGTEIVDVRGFYAWAGPVERDQWNQPPRVGHIPHALPFDFTVFLHPHGGLRDRAENRADFARLGPRPANPVDLSDDFILYGENPDSDGVLAYFLLRRAGVEGVSWYPGGWSEWAGDQRFPVVRIIPADELKWRLERRWRPFAGDRPVSEFAFFDVRHPADYARGHIAGSVSLRSDYFADSLDARLGRYWPNLDRASAPIVTYCYGEYCIRSRAASTAAARAGFVAVERFYGGLAEWQSIGGKVVH
jgi:thiosulfate/3-mercaptopyruvate sulfurtransferase